MRTLGKPKQNWILSDLELLDYFLIWRHVYDDAIVLHEISNSSKVKSKQSSKMSAISCRLTNEHAQIRDTGQWIDPNHDNVYMISVSTALCILWSF